MSFASFLTVAFLAVEVEALDGTAVFFTTGVEVEVFFDLGRKKLPQSNAIRIDET
jgi:hypothetical protein